VNLNRVVAGALVVSLFSVLSAAAQTLDPSPTPAAEEVSAEAPPPDPEPSPVPGPEPSPVSEPEVAEEAPAPPADPEEVEAPVVTSDVPPPPATPRPTSSPVAQSDRRDYPNFNIYLPEGEFDIRLRRLIKNVLFEGQVNYNFVDGDISTFLRYKYYAKNLTYKLGLFDTLEFQSIDDTSGDFDRVRGALLQFEYPYDYDTRYFLLLQDDRILLGDVDDPDNKKNNTYVKLAYQLGTPFDERLNSIAGESRGGRPRVLSAYRDLGPRNLGFAAAATYSFDAVGDYNYLKAELEGIKRFDFGQTTFLVSRIHAGAITGMDERPFPPPGGEFEEDQLDQPTGMFSIPRYEYFRLGGRDAIKSLDSDSRGTEEAHLSNELFAPLFRNRSYRTGPLTWTNLYGIVYAGVGSVGFDGERAADFAGYEFGDLVVDAGLGFEASLDVRDFEVFLSAIYAQTVSSPDVLEGSEFRVSVRTAR
jgi:hypothetical protein